MRVVLRGVTKFSSGLMNNYVHWVLGVQSRPDPHGIDIRVEVKVRRNFRKILLETTPNLTIFVV